MTSGPAHPSTSRCPVEELNFDDIDQCEQQQADRREEGEDDHFFLNSKKS